MSHTGTTNPGAETAVLEVHPVRRTTVRGARLSAFGEADEVLPVETLVAAVADAAALGYGALSLRGDDVLRYRQIGDVLDAARAAGMTTTIMTKATSITASNAARLAGRVDFVAVSLDGPVGARRDLRARRRAFARMIVGVEHLRSVCVPFGFVLSLTEDDLEDLPWECELARRHGALVTEIHPLDGDGRTLHPSATSRRPAGEPLALGALLRSTMERPMLELAASSAVVTGADLADRPDRFLGTGHVGPIRIGEWIRPLVIRADGEVVPLSPDVPAELGLGSLHDQRLADLAITWRADGRADRFADACRHAYDRLSRDRARGACRWPDALVARLGSGPRPAAAARVERDPVPMLVA